MSNRLKRNLTAVWSLRHCRNVSVSGQEIFTGGDSGDFFKYKVEIVDVPESQMPCHMLWRCVSVNQHFLGKRNQFQVEIFPEGLASVEFKHIGKIFFRKPEFCCTQCRRRVYAPFQFSRTDKFVQKGIHSFDEALVLVFAGYELPFVISRAVVQYEFNVSYQ